MNTVYLNSKNLIILLQTACTIPLNNPVQSFVLWAQMNCEVRMSSTWLYLACCMLVMFVDTFLDRARKATENKNVMEDSRAELLEEQLQEARTVAEEAQKRYEEVSH